MHWMHARTGEREVGEVMRRAERRRMRAVLLPTNVVPQLHGQVVLQPPRSEPAAAVDEQPVSLSDLQIKVLHAGCVCHCVN